MSSPAGPTPRGDVAGPTLPSPRSRARAADPALSGRRPWALAAARHFPGAAGRRHRGARRREGEIGALAALAHRDYRLLWSSGAVATTAFIMSFLLMPALAYDITGNNTSAGIAIMGSGVGMFFLSPIGGVIADRLRKKPLVLVGQIIPSLVILAIGVLVVTDTITIVLLTLGTLIMGLGFAFMAPARQAWMAEMVPAALLPNAVALQQIAHTGAQVLAPLAIAVFVGTLLGIGGTYLFMAALFVLILPLTLRLPNTEPAVAPGDRRSVRVELSAGAHYLFSDPQLRLLWASIVAVIVCGFAFQTLLPGFLDEALGHDPTDIGPIFLVFALSGLIINLFLPRIVGTSLAWPVMLGLGLLMAAGFLLLAGASSYGLVMLVAIPMGAGRSGFTLLNQTIMLSNTEPAYYGRITAMTMMAFGSQALLSPVWGALADSIGIRSTLLIVGLVGAVAMVATAVVWFRFVKRVVPSDTTAVPSSRG